MQGTFCVWPCPHFSHCEHRSHSDMKIYTHLLPTNYTWHSASPNLGRGEQMLVLICSVPLPSWAWWLTSQRLPSVLLTCLCLSPSGLFKSAAEGLHKTHQESTQTRPQLQLQTHPSWLQERRQWQVGVCWSWRCRCWFVYAGFVHMSVLFWCLSLSVCLMAGYSGHCWHLRVVLSVFSEKKWILTLRSVTSNTSRSVSL